MSTEEERGQPKESKQHLIWIAAVTGFFGLATAVATGVLDKWNPSSAAPRGPEGPVAEGGPGEVEKPPVETPVVTEKPIIERDEAPTPAPVEVIVLGAVRSKSPDWIEVENQSSFGVDISSHVLQIDKDRWAFPEGTMLKEGETLRIYFFSDKNAADAEAERKKGHIVHVGIGISSGENIRLETPAGELLMERVAP